MPEPETVRLTDPGGTLEDWVDCPGCRSSSVVIALRKHNGATSAFLECQICGATTLNTEIDHEKRMRQAAAGRCDVQVAEREIERIEDLVGTVWELPSHEEQLETLREIADTEAGTNV